MTPWATPIHPGLLGSRRASRGGGDSAEWPRAHVVAYPDVIAVAATLLWPRPRVEQPRTPTEPAWPTLLLDRINEHTGAHHADATPVEQWAQSTDAYSPLPY